MRKMFDVLQNLESEWTPQQVRGDKWREHTPHCHPALVAGSIRTKSFGRKLLNCLFFLIFFLISQPVFAQQKIVERKNHFASLRASETNVRAGPGSQYPIKFTFKLRGLPVKVISEYDNWNEIQDFEGETGWVNQNLLTKKRTVLVRTGKTFVNFYSSPKEKSRLVYRVENNVVGEFISCNQNWCNVRISGKKGWIPRQEIWGAEESKVQENDEDENKISKKSEEENKIVTPKNVKIIQEKNPRKF